MIKSKKELKSILSAEYDLYDKDYGFGSLLNRVKLFFVHDRRYTIWRFQKYMRYADYYKHTYEGMRILNIVLFLWYSRIRSSVGERLGFDFFGYNLPVGLQLYHANIVMNSRATIGINLHLHGENVIGNNAKSSECPTIGNNVLMGAGAKVFGNVFIADDIKIGAGAIVVSSFMEKGITIGGIPAKKIK